MAIDVMRNAALEFHFFPKFVDDLQWSGVSVAAEILDPTGTKVEDGTLDSTPSLTTGGTVDSAQQITLLAGNAAFDRPGDWVFVQLASGEGDFSRIASHDTGTGVLELVEPLPYSTGSVSVRELRVTVTGTAIDKVGHNYRCVLRRTLASTPDRQLTRVFHLVNVPFQGPIESGRVRQYIADHAPGHALVSETGRHFTLAEEANQRLRTRITNQGGYANRYWDADDLLDAGVEAMKLVLAEANFIPAGEDAGEYKRTVSTDLWRRVGELSKGATTHDANDDNKIDDIEERGMAGARLVR